MMRRSSLFLLTSKMVVIITSTILFLSQFSRSLLFHAPTISTTLQPEVRSVLQRTNEKSVFDINCMGRKRWRKMKQSNMASVVSFEKFDYMAHWYPVSWARDVPYDVPTKITLFDTDYVISKLQNSNTQSEDEVIAILDRCPHKSASLSEGRMSSCGKAFQCAYHGWSFDGKSGKCIEIPQVAASEGKSTLMVEKSGVNRADSSAVPAMIQQGMIWLFPGGSLEEALLAPLPPRVPELDLPNYKCTPAIRDFPIDWAILLENIMDPDHGLFAHQAPPFDLYSASKTYPQELTEESTHNGKGWTITSKVDAVAKLTAYEKMQHKSNSKGQNGSTENFENKEDVLTATSTFFAPSHVVLARKDADGISKSKTVFWVSPTGTGKSRFMSAFVSQMPFTPPRWVVHIGLNNFLDQDTHLLMSTQKHILGAEAKAVTESKDNPSVTLNVKSNPRKNLFVYRSPTEKLQARLCAFFDQTLPTVPNRIAALRAMQNTESLPTPSREFSLDRYKQHTQICRDSLDVVRNCDFVMGLVKYGSIALAALKFSLALAVLESSKPPRIARLLNSILRPYLLASFFALVSLFSILAKRIKAEFFFKYTDRIRNNDLAKIPNLWKDPSVGVEEEKHLVGK